MNYEPFKMTTKRFLDETNFGGLDLLNDLSNGDMSADTYHVFMGKIGELTQGYLLPDNIHEAEHFDEMTTVTGLEFQRNEMEDTRYWGAEEHNEYLVFNYENKTETVGTVSGRMLAGKKKIVLNPLVSKFVDNLPADASESDFNRLTEMGIHVGRTIHFPTRRMKSETRIHLWNMLSFWPECTASEDDSVNHTEVRYRCSVPEPIRFRTVLDSPVNKCSYIPPIELI